MNRVYNFSAGPSMLPLPVLEKAQAELLSYGECGMSVMEMSHRSADYMAIIAKAEAGDESSAVFLKSFCISVAKYIGAMATVVAGKVDAIVLTGGIAHSQYITSAISEMVQFIAPVEVYAGENELESLAENGYGILAGEFEVKQYLKK